MKGNYLGFIDEMKFHIEFLKKTFLHNKENLLSLGFDATPLLNTLVDQFYYIS
jgi:hypothetical protein